MEHQANLRAWQTVTSQARGQHVSDEWLDKALAGDAPQFPPGQAQQQYLTPQQAEQLFQEKLTAHQQSQLAEQQTQAALREQITDEIKDVVTRYGVDEQPLWDLVREHGVSHSALVRVAELISGARSPAAPAASAPAPAAPSTPPRPARGRSGAATATKDEDPGSMMDIGLALAAELGG
jgi:ribosomal protein L12E/L44/L45/RPP1/RPP2